MEADAGVTTMVGAELTVADPVEKYCVAAPLEVNVTFPPAPLEAEALSRTYIVVTDTTPDAGVIETEEAYPLDAESETS